MAVQDDIQIYRKRRILYTGLALMMLLFLGRLYQLQLIYSEEYGRKSEENSVRVIPKEPVRGYMYDRNNTLVVDNRPSFTVTLMPYEFDKNTIGFLAHTLSLDTAFIQERLRTGERYSRFAPVKIKRDIDFRELSALEENRDRLPGVDFQVESKRVYTTPAHATHILGYTKEISESQIRNFGGDYTQGDVVGSSGIEGGYEYSLRGEKGAEFSTVNVRGQVVGGFESGKLDVQAVDGKDLILTMDFGLQSFAESLMTGRRGAVVALDPRNGELLAMVSAPDYDLSVFSGVTPPQIWRSMNADPTKPLFNRATLTRYPPGSTFKMVLAIAALESKTVTPSWRVSCTGAFRFGNKTFKDLHVHGSVDMITAIQQSCNVYFYQLMLKTGLDEWAHYGKELGFGMLTGIDIAEENPGLLPTTAFMNRRYGPSGWTRGFLPSLGIGQGELGVTPLQMACYAMVLANWGEYHQPHAVRAVVQKDVRRVDTLAFQSRRTSISIDTWAIVREGMRRAVEHPGGTGGLARIKGIEVAGKTGTAQNPHGLDHAWFVGFAPYDDPRIAIAVLVENAGFGGSHAAPVAGMCMERYLYGALIRNTPSPSVPRPAIAGRQTVAAPLASEER
ncbi:MAG TPA: penicillin-binding protein 2 [Bacteroidota bacterium]|nr:penicillin-binding protein 2 [Bacteroidota bacterium]